MAGAEAPSSRPSPFDLFQRQQGVALRRSEGRITHKRLLSLEFSSQKSIKSVHTGGVTGLDLDHVEQRYLLAGAADASVAIYDTQQPTPPDAAAAASAAALEAGRQEQLEDSSAYVHHAEARPPAAAAQRACVSSSGGGQHQALAVVTKQTPGGHRFSVSCVAWYPVDTGLFVTGSYDKEVKVWDSNSLQPAWTFFLGARVHALAMSAIATVHCLVAVGSAEAQIQLCDVTSGTAVHTLSGHTAGVWALAWSLTSEYELLSGGCDGQLRLWDIRRAGTIHVFDQHQTQALPPQFQRQHQERQEGSRPPSRNGKKPRRQLSSGSNSAGGAGGAVNGGSERMFLPERVTRYATAHGGSISGVAPTPDGLFWLSAGTDDCVRLWDSSSYRNMLVNYPGAFNRTSRARQLAVSGDSTTLFHPSGSVVQMFDVQTGRLLKSLAGGHFESINCCKYNSLSEELYTGGNDSNIVLWAPAPEAVTAERDDSQPDSDADDWSD